jgi:hypothetical protein
VLAPYIAVAEALEKDGHTQRTEYNEFTEQVGGMSEYLLRASTDDDASLDALTALRELQDDLEKLQRTAEFRYNMAKEGAAEAEFKIDYADQILKSRTSTASLAALTMTSATIWEIQGAHDDLQRIFGSLQVARDDYAALNEMIKPDLEFARSWRDHLKSCIKGRESKAFLKFVHDEVTAIRTGLTTVARSGGASAGLRVAIDYLEAAQQASDLEVTLDKVRWSLSFLQGMPDAGFAPARLVLLQFRLENHPTIDSY